MKVDTFLTERQADSPDAAREAEEAGYDGAWLGEVRHDPFVALAVAGMVTNRIELGTGIAIAFARSPMVTAVASNDVQSYSDGRFVLGLGSQIKPHITRRFSMPWSSPAARMREYVLAIRAIWRSWETGDKLDFRGEFYSHTLMPPFFDPGPNPHGNPPILLAGVGPLMTMVAGEVADGFSVHAFTTERYLREVTLPALAAGRASSAKNLHGFEISGLPFVATGHTEEEFEAALVGTRRQIAFYASTPAYRPVLELHGWEALGDELNTLSKCGGWNEMGRRIDDDVLHAFAVVAEPDRVAAELRKRWGQIFTRMAMYTPYSTDPAEWRPIVETLQNSKDVEEQ